MSCEAIIYFSGPRTQWGKRIDETEILARRCLRWQWAASYWARSIHGKLDARRCGYVVLKDGEMLEHVEATHLL